VELIVEGNKRLIVVRVLGALDATTCGTLRDAVQELSHSGRHRVQIDLKEAPFLDTSGVGVLVGLRTMLRMRGGDLQVVDPQPNVRDLFQRLGLEGDFIQTSS